MRCANALVPCLLGFTALLAGCRTAGLGALSPADVPPDPPAVASGVPDRAPAALPPVPDAAATAALSIEEALVLSLSNNRDLRVRQLEPVVVGAFEAIERGVFDPEVYAEIVTRREESFETSRSTQEQFGVAGDENEASVGVRKRFASGTEVDVGLGFDRTNSNRSPEQQRARLGLTVTQSLLRGRGAMVNLAAVQQAEVATQVSRYELRGYVETLLADTKVAYWRYVLALEQRRIVERSLELAKRQLSEIEQGIEVGTLPASEAAVARSEVAFREQALINATSLIEERRLRLLRLIGPPGPVGFGREVDPTTSPGGAADPLDDLEERVVLALSFRPDLNEARLRFKESTLETVITRDGLRPRLDFFVSLGKTGYSDDLIEAFSELGGNTYDLRAGVAFTHKPVDNAARGRHLAAWARRQQAALAIQNLEAVVQLDVRLAANEVERTRRLIGASRTSRELQEMTVRAEQERFQVGATTAILVAQAQRDLLAAQIAEVEAVVNYRIALVRLYLAEGTMLERHGIVMKGS